MFRDRVVKKFYRDLTSEEEVYIEDILADMQDKDLYIPNYVQEKLFHDENFSFDDVIKTLDEGVPYEISNEGVLRNHENPYRIVIAREFMLPSDTKCTLFVKIIPDTNGEKEVVLDIWKPVGALPDYPPSRTIH